MPLKTPTDLRKLFKVSAAGLSNQFLDLASVVPATARFIEGYFTPEMRPDQVKSRLDGYFPGLINKVNFEMDHRLYGAIELILKKKGVVDIETGLDTGISPRQLRRLFAFFLGDSAKICHPDFINHLAQFLLTAHAQPLQSCSDLGTSPS